MISPSPGPSGSAYVEFSKTIYHQPPAACRSRGARPSPETVIDRTVIVSRRNGKPSHASRCRPTHLWRVINARWLLPHETVWWLWNLNVFPGTWVTRTFTGENRVQSVDGKLGKFTPRPRYIKICSREVRTNRRPCLRVTVRTGHGHLLFCCTMYCLTLTRRRKTMGPGGPYVKQNVLSHDQM